jgi:hypothetical protein
VDNIKRKNPWLLFRKTTVSTEQPLLVDDDSANGSLSRFSRPEPLHFIEVVSQLSSRG